MKTSNACYVSMILRQRVSEFLHNRVCIHNGTHRNELPTGKKLEHYKSKMSLYRAEILKTINAIRDVESSMDIK